MNLKEAFHKLFLRQLKKQFALYSRLKKDQDSRLGRDRIVLKNIDDAVEEVIEARREIHVRKEWNPDKCERSMTQIERLQCAEEIIDAFHFLFNALIYLDLDFNQIETVLLTKMGINDEREDHKYE